MSGSIGRSERRRQAMRAHYGRGRYEPSQVKGGMKVRPGSSKRLRRIASAADEYLQRHQPKIDPDLIARARAELNR